MSASPVFQLLVIGAGQLGSRHLQALTQCDVGDMAIHVVDPSLAALNVARERQAQVQAAAGIGSLHFRQSLDEVVPADIDFCVVATGANCRLAVLRELLARKRVHNLLLEKVLFQSVAQLDEATVLLAAQSTKTWVNCPRRQLPGYRLLRERLAGEREVFLHVAGSNWGMACNAIHFVDLWAFLGSGADYRLDTSGLRDVVPSKRPGYSEVTGRLEGRSSAGGFMLEVSLDEAPPRVQVCIESPRFMIQVHEADARCTITHKGDGKVEVLPFPMFFQSQLTHIVARAALSGDEVPLTPFIESAALHRPLLSGILEMFRRHDASLTLCPIT